MTAPRRILEGQFYLITRRTISRMFLLRPEPEVNRAFEYCLAEAAKRFGVEVIAWCAMSNHYHAVIYDPDGRVPAFSEQFHKMSSKVISVHRGRYEGIWSKDQTCLTRLVTMRDVFDKVVYVLSNPAAAHLVEDIAEWPGSSSWKRMGRDATTVARPKAYFREDGRMPAKVQLRAVAPRGLRGESYRDWAARVRAAVKERQASLAKERAKSRRPALGPKRVLKMDPFSTPTTEAPRRKLRPHLACKDKRRMLEERLALKDFRAKYEAARRRLRDGEGRFEFPEGTYRLRLLGLRCKGCSLAADPNQAARAKRKKRAA